MQAFITLIILLGIASLAHANRYPLHGGVSPDTRLEVFADNGKTASSPLTYNIVARRSGKILAHIDSSYGDPANSFDLAHTREATVVWSSDSQLVAIDEEVHRYVGKLFLVHVARGHAVLIDLKGESIKRAAHQPWDRVSIHQPEWISTRTLQVYLHGLLPAVPPAESAHKEFNVSLEVDRNYRVRLKSLQAIASPGA